MALLTTAALALGLMGQPAGTEEGVSVQRPMAPGEPAIAPAKIEAEAATPEGTPAVAEPEGPGEPAIEPAPEVGPAPGPEPDPPPPQPEVGPTEPALPSWQDSPTTSGEVYPEPWEDPATFEKPPGDGIGFMLLAGVAYGGAITRQWVSALRCDNDVYCGYRGITDHVLMFATAGLAMGGGWKHGNRKAWDLDRAGQPIPVPRGRRIAGWTLFAAGMAGVIVDLGLYNACYSDAKGPYTKIDGLSYTCSPVASVLVNDFSGLAAGLGGGLAMSAEAQIKYRQKLELTLLPRGGPGQFGLSLAGRF